MQIKFIEKIQQPLCGPWDMGAAAVGAGISAIGQGIANEQNFEHNKELMGLQFGYNERAAENAYNRQRDLNAENWKLYNSYEAQRASMEAAGLSPALMYGQHGVGGSGAGNTAPQGNGAGLANVNVGNIGAAAIQGAQLGLMNAEIRKTNAEAKNIEDLTPAQVEDTWASVNQRNANIRYQLAQERMSQLLGDNQEIKNAAEGQHQLYALIKEFKDIQLQTIKYEREGRLNRFEAETYDEKVEQFKLQTQRMATDIALLNSQKELTDANKQLVQKEFQNFDTKLQALVMQAMGAYNQGQAAKVNATAAVVELNNNLKVQGIKLDQENLKLYIEASKVSGAAAIGLEGGLGGGRGGKGLHAGVNLSGSGSGNRARKDAKNNYWNGTGYTAEFMPEIVVDWKEIGE